MGSRGGPHMQGRVAESDDAAIWVVIIGVLLLGWVLWEDRKRKRKTMSQSSISSSSSPSISSSVVTSDSLVQTKASTASKKLESKQKPKKKVKKEKPIELAKAAQAAKSAAKVVAAKAATVEPVAHLSTPVSHSAKGAALCAPSPLSTMTATSSSSSSYRTGIPDDGSSQSSLDPSSTRSVASHRQCAASDTPSEAVVEVDAEVEVEVEAEVDMGEGEVEEEVEEEEVVPVTPTLVAKVFAPLRKAEGAARAAIEKSAGDVLWKSVHTTLGNRERSMRKKGEDEERKEREKLNKQARVKLVKVVRRVRVQQVKDAVVAAVAAIASSAADQPPASPSSHGTWPDSTASTTSPATTALSSSATSWKRPLSSSALDRNMMGEHLGGAPSPPPTPSPPPSPPGNQAGQIFHPYQLAMKQQLAQNLQQQQQQQMQQMQQQKLQQAQQQAQLQQMQMLAQNQAQLSQAQQAQAQQQTLMRQSSHPNMTNFIQNAPAQGQVMSVPGQVIATPVSAAAAAAYRPSAVALPMCPHDKTCKLINDVTHYPKFMHTCRMAFCPDAHKTFHNSLFVHECDSVNLYDTEKMCSVTINVSLGQMNVGAIFEAVERHLQIPKDQQLLTTNKGTTLRDPLAMCEECGITNSTTILATRAMPNKQTDTMYAHFLRHPLKRHHCHINNFI